MRSSSVDCIVHFRRKYLKGLLSIPSDGRGARRPLGQSFRKSVGPAALKRVSPLIAVTYSFGRYMSTLCDVCRGTCQDFVGSKEAMGEAEESGEVGS